MILNKFLSKIDYKSYEDLYKNFKITIPNDFNFAYDVVDEYAKTEPKREALVWCDDNDESHIYTFKDLSLASQRTANFLVEQGIQKGDRVMLILRRRYEFWFFLLALHRIGAIAIPATNMLAAEDLEYRFNAAEIKMVVTYDDPALQKEVDKAKSKCESVEKLVTVGQTARQNWISFYDDYELFPSTFERPVGDAATHNDDIMIVYFTSGTSSNPKMVAHTYTYPLGHIVTAKYWQHVVDGGRHLTVAETGWAKALWGKIYGQWIAGSAVFTYDMTTFIPGKLLEKMAEYKVTTFCAPPTVYRYILQHGLSKYDLSSLQYCTTAGEALNLDIYNRFYEQTGIRMQEGYGQTELTLTTGNFGFSEPHPGSIGKPSPGYQMEIINAEGKPCEAEEVGELIIKIDQGKPFGMFGGYYRNAERTEKVFEGGVYHTGDTAYRDKDGFFWFVGRTDDLIKSSGYRISPFEVEEVLHKHPAVLEVAVTGVEDKSRGQAVKATVVLQKGYEASKELAKEIQLFAKNIAASYKSPRIIDFVTELPKTISGKIRRATIRDKDTAENVTAPDEANAENAASETSEEK
ncbi:AMP-dependent synthetase and ligase [Fibrobacter succinogenes subsp. succinogenes S85]|uniref:AMP-dependent synthetase and ligase n=1 Tax=Fibrobacter succinogenes (strain ATCC 19169 / S85) TaxID=59374 RepID=A0ABN3Z1B4_FIBSS|nr:AMP-binding protein [Fibrobacter succinogenes]ACX76611.1 AMP-dependent synthetase and ligase [Fibrobacter succinogenes subsp. succinogenes S85]